MVRKEWRRKETIVKNTTIITEPKNRRNVGLSVIRHVVKQNAEALYIKGMEKRLTTKDHTAQVHWLMFQLVSLVSQQIVSVNLNVLNRFLH